MRPHPYLRAYMAGIVVPTLFLLVITLPLGVHGALLILLIIPGGVMLARLLDAVTIQWRFALQVVPIGMTVYYLAWNFLVGFLNGEVGIAEV